MEPFEWLVFGVGIVLGGLFGAKGKGAVKSAAKGYLIAGEKAQEWAANVREDFRDALEEARYEKEQEEAARLEELEAIHHSANDRPLVAASSKGSSNNARKASSKSAGEPTSESSHQTPTE